MKLLLDTHSFLWFIGGDNRLSPVARTLIQDANNDVFLSIASLWEMTIKISLNRLKVNTQTGQIFEFILQNMSSNYINLLSITISHVAKVAILEFYHRDPFDRLLAAQSMIEQMPIISRDPAFDAYGVTRLW